MITSSVLLATNSGQDAPEYNVETSEDRKAVTCWIASEVGKTFIVHWRNRSYYVDTAGHVNVDGSPTGGTIIRGCNVPKTVEKKGISDGLTVQQFKFSSLEITDDDDFLGGAIHPDLGLDIKLHERAKKDVTQHTTLGETEQLARPHPLVSSLRTGADLVKFSWKYRPITILQANKIAPLPPTLKRKASADLPRVPSQIDKCGMDTEEVESLPEKLDPKMVVEEEKKRCLEYESNTAIYSPPDSRSQTVKLDDKELIILGVQPERERLVEPVFDEENKAWLKYEPDIIIQSSPESRSRAVKLDDTKLNALRALPQLIFKVEREPHLKSDPNITTIKSSPGIRIQAVKLDDVRRFLCRRSQAHPFLQTKLNALGAQPEPVFKNEREPHLKSDLDITSIKSSPEIRIQAVKLDDTKLDFPGAKEELQPLVFENKKEPRLKYEQDVTIVQSSPKTRIQVKLDDTKLNVLGNRTGPEPHVKCDEEFAIDLTQKTQNESVKSEQKPVLLSWDR
ncbi:hypothetical protein DFH09DRAFT_1374833 [Mycena vulgaris]|nr:hypothetical protein DFH09DRAFT_1374833 [Mycena vulgaris]